MESRFVQLKEDLVTLSKLSNDVFNILDNQTLQFLLNTFPETPDEESSLENVYSMVIFEDILDFSALMIKGLLRVRRDLRRQKQAINSNPRDLGRVGLIHYRPLVVEHQSTCEENVPFARIPLGGEEEIICVQPKECLIPYGNSVETPSKKFSESIVGGEITPSKDHSEREAIEGSPTGPSRSDVAEGQAQITMPIAEKEIVGVAALESDSDMVGRKGSTSYSFKEQPQTSTPHLQLDSSNSSVSIDKGHESSEEAEEFCCGDCGKVFAQHGSLIRHTYSSHSTQISSLYKCKYCRKLFNSFDHYKDHECRAKGKRRSVKTVITQGGNETSDPQPHMDDKVEGKRERALSEEDNGKQPHANYGEDPTCHGNPEDRESKSESFTDDSNLPTSDLNESKTFVCPKCKYLFNNIRDLEMHSCAANIERKNLIENMERPKFSLFSDHRPSLATMTDSSTGDSSLQGNSKARARVCKLCGGYFATYSALIDHRHIHIREYPFQCSSCEKAYKTGGELKRHQHVHTGERPYGCEFCGRYFALSHHLKRHVQTHLES